MWRNLSNWQTSRITEMLSAFYKPYYIV
ncbi:hypothetical protein DXA74_04600 [Bacteroides sp. OF04-15BH]|nr:hypothetical protein DXA74_04600 [Bacteroides sp. OF04-15BH]